MNSNNPLKVSKC